MELGQEQAAACPRATSSVPSPCHLPELYLPLLPSPLLPFWLLSVFFYVLVLFYRLLSLSCFSEGRSVPARPGTRKIITKAKVGFSVNSLPLRLDSLNSQ